MLHLNCKLLIITEQRPEKRNTDCRYRQKHLKPLATMSRLLFVILLFGSCSCNPEQERKNINYTKDTTIQLQDSLGNISLQIPHQTDTLLKWIHISDCGKPCDKSKYRFQPKNYPIFKETGFYWTGQPQDSVNQLTISHTRDIHLFADQDSFAIKNKEYFKVKLLSDPETSNIVSDTVERVGDRLFSIFKISDYDKSKGVHIRRLIAFTSIKGNEVEFRYDLLTRKKDATINNFFNESRKNLHTIRIEKGG